MVGILVSLRDGLFSGTMLVSGRVMYHSCVCSSNFAPHIAGASSSRKGGDRKISQQNCKGSVGSEGENTKTCICYIIHDICVYMIFVYIYIYIVYSYDIYINTII